MVEVGEGLVFEGVDYVCFDKTTLDGKSYLYLTTVDEPFRIRFAEIITKDDKAQIRLIGEREIKLKLIADLQDRNA